jgi:hypothetical protein
MKKIYLLLVLISCAFNINAQDEEKQYNNDEFKTIFGGKQVGGYGALGGGYSLIDGKNALVINARGAAVMNHWLALGLAGSGFINEYTYNPAINDDVSLVGGYGGFFIEPIIFPKSGVHLSFPLVAGGGGISYTTFNEQKDQFHKENNIQVSQSFFILEPSAELEFNLFKCMRLSFYYSYRFISNLDWENTSSNALTGPTVGMMMKFGKF